MVRDLLSNKGEPDAAMDLLEDIGLPADMAWAMQEPRIAAAFGRFATMVEARGVEGLPDTVREMVRQRLTAWQGEEMPLDPAWLEAAVAELEERERPAGRLALLTALASYRVDAVVIEAFQRICPGDAALLKATAWAGFAAARRVGSWLMLGGQANLKKPSENPR